MAGPLARVCGRRSWESGRGEMRRRSQRTAAAGQPVARQRGPGGQEGVAWPGLREASAVRDPTSDTQLSRSHSPRLGFPPPAVAEFRSSRSRRCPDAAPAAAHAAASPAPGPAGLTWGRGPALPTAPSSSSARRSGPGAPAMAGLSGLGHRCHLRHRARH